MNNKKKGLFVIGFLFVLFIFHYSIFIVNLCIMNALAHNGYM